MNPMSTENTKQNVFVFGAMITDFPAPHPPSPSPLARTPCLFQIRQLVEELDGLGILNDALLVLASDNGGCPDGGGSNYPFRGIKHTLFEGGVRVPAFVYSKSENLIPAEVNHTCVCVCVFIFLLLVPTRYTASEGRFKAKPCVTCELLVSIDKKWRLR